MCALPVRHPVTVVDGSVNIMSGGEEDWLTMDDSCFSMLTSIDVYACVMLVLSGARTAEMFLVRVPSVSLVFTTTLGSPRTGFTGIYRLLFNVLRRNMSALVESVAQAQRKVSV